jgi:hypothetical protein
MMHLFCKWSPWSSPTTHQMVHVLRLTGQRTEFIERRQQRSCEKCGRVQERVL